MKRVYNLLGAQPGGLGHRLRNVLEFCGGVTDNYLCVLAARRISGNGGSAELRRRGSGGSGILRPS
jgi:hypothetical protein